MAETMLRDIRQAVRALSKQPSFALIALTMLALGIGANAAMFSIVYAMLLRPLPYPGQDAIVRIGVQGGQSPAPWLFRRRSEGFDDRNDVADRGGSRGVRAGRRLSGEGGGLGEPERRGNAERRASLAVDVPAVAGAAPPRPVLHRG